MARIAVIDDDQNMRDLLRIHLTAIGVTVHVYSDASVGIRGILETPPDLLVLDLILPDLSGLEILRAVKSDAATKHIPVVVLTSRLDEDAAIQAQQLGADAFLTKPIQREELIDGIVSQLVKRSIPAA